MGALDGRSGRAGGPGRRPRRAGLRLDLAPRGAHAHRRSTRWSRWPTPPPTTPGSSSARPCSCPGATWCGWPSSWPRSTVCRPAASSSPSCPAWPSPRSRGRSACPAKEKGARMEEAFPLLRRLWAGESVDHRGDVGEFDRLTLSPLPVQQPLEFWTGGMLPAALRRCGRFADGWLPSSCTPEEVAAGPHRDRRGRSRAPAGRSAASTSASRSPTPRARSTRNW